MSASMLAAWLGALQLVGVGVLVIAALVACCARRASAARRRAIWALAVAVLLSLPISRLGLSVAAIELPEWVAQALVGAWALGASLLLARQLYAIGHARALVEQARPIEDPRWRASLAELGADAQLRALDELESPLVAGFLRPVILIPTELLDVPADERRSLLAHELAHVLRADNLLLHAAVLARAIYWVTPLPWWSLRRLREEIENAADDAVLEAGISSVSYAAQLLALGRAQLGRAGRVATTQLRARIEAILDRERRRGGVVGALHPRRALVRLVSAAMLLASLATACEARSDDREPASIGGAVQR